MARTIRRKTKDEVYSDKERNGIKQRKNISRNNTKKKFRQLDYNDPAVLDELEDEY